MKLQLRYRKGKDIKKEKILNFIKQNKKSTLIVTGFVLVLICVITAISIHDQHVKEEQERIKKEQQQAVKDAMEYNEMVECYYKICDISYTGASSAEKICVTIYNTWKDSIFNSPNEDTKKYVNGAKDFNEAVENVYEDDEIRDQLNDVNNTEDDLDDYIRKIQNPPEKFDKCYDAAIDLNTSFKQLADLANDPSGMNLSDYGDAESERIDSFVSDAEKLKSVIPQKKEIPTYDDTTKEIYEEFAFFDYYLQPCSEAPGTEYTSGMNAEEKSVYGIDGQVYYVGFGTSKLLTMVSFSSNKKVSDEDFEKIVSNLETYCGKKAKKINNDSYIIDCGDKVQKSISITNDDTLSIFC